MNRTFTCGKCAREVEAVSVPELARPSREGYALVPHGTVWGGECTRDRVRVECKCGQIEYSDADTVIATVAVGGRPWRFCGGCRERVNF